MPLQKRLGSHQLTWYDLTYHSNDMKSDRSKIAMSSVTPLSGRLAGIFTPRIYVIFSGFLLAAGLFTTAAAPTLAVFLLGRAVTGIGSGGLMSAAIILVLDLASPKRRGLYIGLINAGYTTGVASGAVLAGLLTPRVGWVSLFPISYGPQTDHHSIPALSVLDSGSCGIGVRPAALFGSSGSSR
jgi:MFS family permease